MNDITLVSNKDATKRYSVGNGETVAGRSPDAGIYIASDMISRRHAMFKRDGHVVYITDLGSLNGTYVNTERIERTKQVLLFPGDRVRFATPTEEYCIHGNVLPDSTFFAVNEVATLAAGEITQQQSTQYQSTNRQFGFLPSSITFLDQGLSLPDANTLAKKYHPLQLLNSGGMGKVFLVQEILTGRVVALKVMLDSVRRSPPHLEQFVREAVITARLQHTNIIPVYDLGLINQNELYYTMRYVDGVPFSRLIADLNVSLLQKLAVLVAAASGVAYAHTAGLWHRDVKPDNILVSKTDEVFVIDWGLVSVQPGHAYRYELPSIVLRQEKVSFDDILMSSTNNALTTRSGKMGTPKYMAPEQCDDSQSEAGAVSDIWAFGIMLFEALTGEHPIPESHGLRAVELVEKLKHIRCVPRPSEIRPDIPHVLDTLCSNMLSADPTSRMLDLSIFIATVKNHLALQT
jgi:serine/threonine protein kinase